MKKGTLQKLIEIMESDIHDDKKVIEASKILEFKELYKIAREVGAINFCCGFNTKIYKNASIQAKESYRDVCATSVRRAYGTGNQSSRRRIMELIEKIVGIY